MSNLLHVFALDDDPTSSFLLKQFIELHTSRPLQFDTATTVDEALDQLVHFHGQQQFPRLIFVDIRLPFKSGFAFIEAFEHTYFDQYPNCLVYVLSSSTRMSDKEQSARYPSVQKFIQKSDLDDQLAGILANA